MILQGIFAHDGARMIAPRTTLFWPRFASGMYCTHARLQRDGADWRRRQPKGALVTGLLVKSELPNERLLAEILFTARASGCPYRINPVPIVVLTSAPEQVLEVCTQIMTHMARAAFDVCGAP
jgi:hypothetical protein